MQETHYHQPVLRAIVAGLWLGLLLAWSSSVYAERLPIQTYTTADGLVRDNVTKIVLDSRGFLWICTPDGLSRFDGHTFTNYTTAQGLPHRLVTDLLETRGGVYWVATYGGLCRFNPKASPAVRPRTGEPRAAADGSGSPAGSEPQFVVYRLSEDAKAQRVTVLLEDRAGTIWCGTDGGGLYRLERVNNQWKFHFVDLGWPGESSRNLEINALLQDRQGTLWIGTETGLYRRWPDGHTDHYTTQHGLPSNGVKTLLEDRDGRLWAGTAFGGLCRIVSEPKPNRPVVAQVYTTKDGLPHNWVASLLQASDGRLWVSTTRGLGVFIPATTTQ